MRKKICIQCGLARNFMIRVEMQEGTNKSAKLGWTCFPCFFKAATEVELASLPLQSVKRFYDCINEVKGEADGEDD